jgi:hypothetical protein
MTKSLVISVGLAALVFSGLFSLNQSQYDNKKSEHRAMINFSKTVEVKS